MIKEEFRKILLKYSEGKASNEEIKLIESYYDLLDKQPDGLEGTDAGNSDRILESLKINLQEGLRSLDHHPGSVKRKVHSLWRYSAAAVVLLAVTASILFMKSFKADKEIVSTISLIKEENRVRVLPDGSIVYLKGDSRIFYPLSFENLSTREVVLEGEAFFDVVHNSSQPFIVKAGHLETVVIGTSFNIQMNSEVNDVVTVTVKSGKVNVFDRKRVSLGVLTKNQQIVYSGSKFNIVKHIAAENFLEWKNYDLVLEEVTLSEACRILENRFHTKIMLNPEFVNADRFTATFNKDETVETAIKIISAFNAINYDFDSSANSAKIGY